MVVVPPVRRHPLPLLVPARASVVGKGAVVAPLDAHRLGRARRGWDRLGWSASNDALYEGRGKRVPQGILGFVHDPVAFHVVKLDLPLRVPNSQLRPQAFEHEVAALVRLRGGHFAR